jgi:hypothetical protein
MGRVDRDFQGRASRQQRTVTNAPVDAVQVGLPDSRCNLTARVTRVLGHSQSIKAAEAERCQLTVLFCDLIGSIVLTLRVIDSAELAQAVTDELRRRLTGIVPPGRVP